MSRRRDSAAEQVAPASPESEIEVPPVSAWRRALGGLLLVGVAAIPLAISFDGDDHFRLPKQLLLYALVIAGAAGLAAGIVLDRIRLDRAERARLRPFAFVGAAGILWSVLSAVLSTNRTLAAEALIWGGALVALFFVSAIVLPAVSVEVLGAALALPALINTVIISLQASQIWNPWVFEPNTPFRATKNALLGNPDDVGVYLAVPLLFVSVLALTARRLRLVWLVLAGVLAVGTLLSMTLTAIAAFAAALAVLLIRWDHRKGLVIVLLATFAFLATAYAYAPMRKRVAFLAWAVTEQHWGRVVSGRLLPFATTAEIFRTNPLTGVGPGCFKYEYMPQRVAVEDRWPGLARESATGKVNFGEAHNDHLQILAELGLPGYLTVIAAIALVAAVSFRATPSDSDRARVAHALALPLAVMLAVTMLAQFALQIAAPAATYLLLAGACVGWRDDVA